MKLDHYGLHLYYGSGSTANPSILIKDAHEKNGTISLYRNGIKVLIIVFYFEEIYVSVDDVDRVITTVNYNRKEESDSTIKQLIINTLRAKGLKELLNLAINKL